MRRILIIATLLLIAITAQAELAQFASGNPADVRSRLHGPVLILDGGGGSDDEWAPFQLAVDTIRGCTGCDRAVDVVVLRASGTDGWNKPFMSLKGVDSVLSLVITDRESSSRPDVIKAVKDAEVVFFAGGDQCNYIRWIKGTPVEEAVKSVYGRGGAIGGSSAGLAIQGEISYDACPDQSATSAVLKDPYHVDVSLSSGFFAWPPMQHVITDTHFKKRDRLGRLLVFLARSLGEGKNERLVGFGVEEGATAIVDANGKAVVLGGPVNVIVADHRAEVLERGKPLTYRGFRIWRFEKGQKLDLKNLPATGFKTIDVVDGVLSADPY